MLGNSAAGRDCQHTYIGRERELSRGVSSPAINQNTLYARVAAHARVTEYSLVNARLTKITKSPRLNSETKTACIHSQVIEVYSYHKRQTPYGTAELELADGQVVSSTQHVRNRPHNFNYSRTKRSGVAGVTPILQECNHIHIASGSWA